MFTFQIFSDMLSELDFDSDGQISLEEWLKGGMENIPLQVLLGLDVVSIKKIFPCIYNVLFMCKFTAWSRRSFLVIGIFFGSICSLRIFACLCFNVL